MVSGSATVASNIGGWRCGKSLEVRVWYLLGRRLRAGGLWSRSAVRSCECPRPDAASNIQDQKNRKQDCRSHWGLLLGHCSPQSLMTGLHQPLKVCGSDNLLTCRWLAALSRTDSRPNSIVRNAWDARSLMRRLGWSNLFGNAVTVRTCDESKMESPGIGRSQ